MVFCSFSAHTVPCADGLCWMCTATGTQARNIRARFQALTSQVRTPATIDRLLGEGLSFYEGCIRSVYPLRTASVGTLYGRNRLCLSWRWTWAEGAPSDACPHCHFSCLDCITSLCVSVASSLCVGCERSRHLLSVGCVWVDPLSCKYIHCFLHGPR
jgi:hypothetical protein